MFCVHWQNGIGGLVTPENFSINLANRSSEMNESGRMATSVPVNARRGDAWPAIVSGSPVN